MGDEAWENVLRWHDEVLRGLIEEHDGEVVHSTGDGFFAAFAEIDAAAACAISIQRRLAEHRRTARVRAARADRAARGGGDGDP